MTDAASAVRVAALLALFLLPACAVLYADPDRTVLLTPLGPVTEDRGGALADEAATP